MSKENARGMQDDAISRQVVLNEFCHSCDGWSCNPNTCCKTEWIRKLPTIHPEHGTDCISKQQAIKTVGWYSCHSGDELLFADNALRQLPPIQPKRGRWIKLDMHRGMADHKCTACEQECYVPTCMGEPMYAYCPNCGADMREETT